MERLEKREISANWEAVTIRSFVGTGCSLARLLLTGGEDGFFWVLRAHHWVACAFGVSGHTGRSCPSFLDGQLDQARVEPLEVRHAHVGLVAEAARHDMHRERGQLTGRVDSWRPHHGQDLALDALDEAVGVESSGQERAAQGSWIDEPVSG